ncbi:polysaccharide deacetylase family protein [Paenibacillus sp. 3LSP]|uniref:polysaccharide deacetylase family protein n=1 Tax=Paenibacillus sp. 3LSP TaxID=2800795 RepID=UPI0028FDA741|nr:polysaccharide deacetylase family protein [Paenibacillus sp. 3LSP]MDU0329504.1 polysaccharide deacetylase family protein [Paenibacillus sp. 3LSP]
MGRNKFAVIAICIALMMILGQFAGIRAFVAKSSGEDSYAFRLIHDLTGDLGAQDQPDPTSGGTAKDTDPLLDKIREEAEKQRIEPIDAVVDRVWKAIPGYNGREVDIERTYEKAKLLPEGANIEYVYRELRPKVNLEDLGPQPIYRGNPNKPMAALMINVAWGNEYLVPMLDTLDQQKVKATFFLDGSWLKKNGELAAEIKRRGHQIENHAYSHPNMSQLEQTRARLEISKTKELLKEKLGVENRWFAPPSGDYNMQTVKLAAEQGLKTVLWTVDTVDWKNPPATSIVSKISNNVGPGTLILMHPTAASRNALEGMIQAIRSKGLVLGTVEQTLSPDRVEVPVP